jgi:hypothetical protein
MILFHLCAAAELWMLPWSGRMFQLIRSERIPETTQG